MNKNELINIVKTSINNAELEKSQLNHDILNLNGMSSPKIRHFLNNVINSQSRYLEIGCWKGSTFCSAMYNNHPNVAFVIDNFLYFTYGDIKQIFLDNTKLYVEHDFSLIAQDCFKIDPQSYKINNINTYLYDGDHSYDSQKLALTYYYNYLADYFIFLVDDWFQNPDVQNGTRDGIKCLELEILYEYIAPCRTHNDQNWWNGYYISVLEKK